MTQTAERERLATQHETEKHSRWILPAPSNDGETMTQNEEH